VVEPPAPVDDEDVDALIVHKARKGMPHRVTLME
jgi:hypothetical protein